MYGAQVQRMIRSAKGLSNRQRRRIAESAVSFGMRQRQILLAVLAQQDGSITVQDTALVRFPRIADLDYEVLETEPGTHVVRLLERGQPVTPVRPALEIHAVPDEEVSAPAPAHETPGTPDASSKGQA